MQELESIRIKLEFAAVQFAWFQPLYIIGNGKFKVVVQH